MSLTELNQILTQVSPKTPEELKNELACRAGLNPDEVVVENVANEWAKNCLIVELNIGRARFERALQFPDLGLDDKDLEDYISSIYPGRQVLVTGQYKRLYHELNNLDRQARRVVERYGIKTEFGYAVSCVPGPDGVTPFEKMLQKLEQIEQRYYATYHELIQQLDEIKAYTEQVMYGASVQIWQRMQRDNSLPPEDFRQEFVKKIMSNFPSRDHVRNMYMFRIRTKFIPLTQTRSELDSEHSAFNLRAEIVETIRRSYREQVEGFITDVLAHIRRVIYDSVSLALNALRKSGSLPGPTIVGLRKMIEQVKHLNFANDQVVLAQVERLEKALDKTRATDERELALLLEQLEQENRQFLMLLGQAPRATRILNEEDFEEEAEATVRKRRRLNVQEEAEVPEVERKVRKKRVIV